MLSAWLSVFIWILLNKIQFIQGSLSSSFSTSTISPSMTSTLMASALSLASSSTSQNASLVTTPFPTLASLSSSKKSQGSGSNNNEDCLERMKGVMIATMHSPPYAFKNTNDDDYRSVRGVMADCILSSLKICFYACPHPLEISWKVVNTSEELVEEITSGRSDIILPITSALVNNLSWPDFRGLPIKFHSIVKTSGSALIIDKQHFNHKSKELMLQALLDTWPMFVYTFILAGLSGICIWLLESRGNRDEFQSTFSKGWWQGFWWAFVSMTTVGYGDKTPKSVLGRVFGVLWILVGIGMIAMFTATATTALTLTNSGIENKKVAVLSSTGASFDAANRGAQPTDYSSFQEMYEALKSNQVEGILIDKHLGAHYMKEVSDPNLRVLSIIDNTIDYMIAVDAGVYREMTKNLCVLESLSLFSCDRLLQKYLSPIKIFSFNEDYEGLLSSSSEGSMLLIYVLLIILCSALVLGFWLELVNNRYPQAFSHLPCNNKQQANESASEMKGFTTRVSPSGFSAGRNTMFGSLDIRTQDHIKQLKNTNTRLKQLSDEIQSVRNTISLVLGSKQTDGAEQGKMPYGGV